MSSVESTPSGCTDFPGGGRMSLARSRQRRVRIYVSVCAVGRCVYLRDGHLIPTAS